MRKLSAAVAVIALLSGTSLASLEGQQSGAGAMDSSGMGRENHWQNWIFAGSAMVTAALGIFMVSIGNGQSTSTSH